MSDSGGGRQGPSERQRQCQHRRQRHGDTRDRLHSRNQQTASPNHHCINVNHGLQGSSLDRRLPAISCCPHKHFQSPSLSLQRRIPYSPSVSSGLSPSPSPSLSPRLAPSCDSSLSYLESQGSLHDGLPDSLSSSEHSLTSGYFSCLSDPLSLTPRSVPNCRTRLHRKEQDLQTQFDSMSLGGSSIASGMTDTSAYLEFERDSMLEDLQSPGSFNGQSVERNCGVYTLREGNQVKEKHSEFTGVSPQRCSSRQKSPTKSCMKRGSTSKEKCESPISLRPVISPGHFDGEPSGCCPLPPAAAEKHSLKSLASWMSKQVEAGTSALMDFLPALGPGEDFHVVMIGLDGAGKTTALYRMQLDQFLPAVPTVGFNCERIKGTLGKSAGKTFLIWDVGGQEKIRPLWRSYTRCTDGILFIVDSCCPGEVLEEARMELKRTISYQDNRHCPLLVLANKQDLQEALSAPEVAFKLGVQKLQPSLAKCIPVSALRGQGLQESLEILQHMILKKREGEKKGRSKQ